MTELSEAEMAKAITEGVRQAFVQVLDAQEMLEAIREGTRLAFDVLYGETIANAITDGVREAMER